MPSTDAVTVACPTPPRAFARTPGRLNSGLFVKFTILVSLDVHAIGLQLSVLPSASRSDAESCSDPKLDRNTVSGANTMLATGCSTLRARVPLCPEASAVIVALPRATPVTTPVADTRAMVESEDDQLSVATGK